jgi:hypothetical protein
MNPVIMRFVHTITNMTILEYRNIVTELVGYLQ